MQLSIKIITAFAAFPLLIVSVSMKILPNSTQTVEAIDLHQKNCTPAAIFEFPSDGLTRADRKAGWIAVHVLITSYCFIMLSLVCDEHFVPAIQTLVQRLKISEDVAGASFMAITSASPELFINCIGTFVTEGDIGVGTVVGSNVFNILAVPACCGLFAKMAFDFDWWSITRDGLTYAISVILLIATLYDDKVFWYEALILVLCYMAYIAVMYYNNIIHKMVHNCVGVIKKSDTAQHELATLHGKEPDNSTNLRTDNKLCAAPSDNKIWWYIIWPTMFLLKCTMPDCKKLPSIYLLTLLMCMIWIGSISYMLAWLITAIGDTISIPDSVMGLSFLAVGSSMPEIVSCIIVAKQGQGVMGMSSALGANTFEVLLCLGLPWLIKSLFCPKTSGNHWIDINSSGLAYNSAYLLSMLVFLYICLVCNRYRLDWKVGLICLIMYGLFLVVATLIELNVFFAVNIPTCT